MYNSISKNPSRMNDFMIKVRMLESTNNYHNNKNPLYKGAYQFGEDALIQSGYYEKNANASMS